MFLLHEGLFFVAYQLYLLPVVQKETSTSQNDPDQPDIRFRHLVQDLPVAVYTCDCQGFITYYNAAAEKLWGRSPVIGKDAWCGSWRAFDAEGNTVSFDRGPVAIALKEGRSVRGVEYIVERPDGKRLNVLPHPDPIRDEKGNISGAVSMVVDITDHKKIFNIICNLQYAIITS